MNAQKADEFVMVAGVIMSIVLVPIVWLFEVLLIRNAAILHQIGPLIGALVLLVPAVFWTREILRVARRVWRLSLPSQQRGQSRH